MFKSSNERFERLTFAKHRIERCLIVAEGLIIGVELEDSVVSDCEIDVGIDAEYLVEFRLPTDQICGGPAKRRRREDALDCYTHDCEHQ